MNREDIIRMAREAGAKDYGTGEEGVTALMLRNDAIERFATLIAAAEREACAKLADAADMYNRHISQEIAAAIRARSMK